MHKFKIFAGAERGARKYQEDSWDVWHDRATEASSTAPPSRLIAVLADGMGGHAAGERASALACHAFVDAMRDGWGGRAGDTPVGNAELHRALAHANEAITREVAANNRLTGMGTTLVGTCFGPAGLEWVSVGDSPLYLWRNGEIATLNEDHSLAPALDERAARGEITVEAARADPARHMLRSALTGEDIAIVDLPGRPLTLAPDDYVILASDGIHTLDLPEIARVVTGYAVDGPDAVVRALMREIDLARHPFQDNVTILAVRVLA